MHDFIRQRSKVPTLLSAFITLLNDRLGETIVFPLLPFLLERFTSSGSTLGLLAGTYAISQFTVAPLIGAPVSYTHLRAHET